MRLTHFALALTMILLAITGYLAWEGQQEARGARKELEFVKRQQAAQESAHPKAENVVSIPQATTPTAEPAPSPVAVVPAAAEIAPPSPGSFATTTTTPTTPMAGATALPGITPAAPAAVAVPTPKPASTLTPMQQKVKDAPTVAQVKAVEKDQGFIVINVGTKQQITSGMRFEIRRDAAVLGRVTVGETIDVEESVANLDLSSIPAGVSIEVGDDIIKPVGS